MTPPNWFSIIDFEKVETFLKSSPGKDTVKDAISKPTAADTAINEMVLVPPQKIKEPYTI